MIPVPIFFLYILSFLSLGGKEKSVGCTGPPLFPTTDMGCSVHGVSQIVARVPSVWWAQNVSLWEEYVLSHTWPSLQAVIGCLALAMAL